MARARPSSIGRAVNALEEGIIALLFAAMTAVTFSQVVARYVFNTGAVWALELTVYLFAWLVLFGMSYGVKVHAHLGIDAFVKLFSSRGAAGLRPARRGGRSDLRRDFADRLVGLRLEAVPDRHRVRGPADPAVGADGDPADRAGAAPLPPRAQAGVRIWRGEQRSLLADEAQQTIADFLGRADREPASPGRPPCRRAAR